MPRLFGFDYTTPFFYMVTLKRLPGFADFSAISDDGRLERNAITVAFEETVAHFHEKWRCIKGHRAAKPGTSEWDSLVGSAARIGPGGAGASGASAA